MDFGSLIRLLSWFVPIPFMFLYHVKSDELDTLLSLLSPYVLVGSSFLFVASFFVQFPEIGFHVPLMAFYFIACTLAFMLFYIRYDATKALSLAVCVTAVGYWLWEVPYFIFTIFVRGYVDVSMPLHLLPLFIFAFVISKVEVQINWKVLYLIGLSLAVSTYSVFFLTSLGADIFWTYHTPPNLLLICEITWYIVRAICFGSLYWIYYKYGRLRHGT